MRVLGIGVATLDVVNLVADYPSEDAEVRALEQRLSRGGNVTNTLVVLSQFGHRCAWAGVLADEPDSEWIVDDLHRSSIDTEHCVRSPGGKTPTSYICVSRASGSRTIVHYRDLPEFSADDFRRIDLEPWDWVHFEGRNPDQTVAMLSYLRGAQPGLLCSLEVEKPRPGIDQLFALPDVLLFSRQFARSRGFTDAGTFLRAMRGLAPFPLLVCAWGELGAAALDGAGRLWRSPSFPPPRVQDTLGAGDVFNAGVIHGLLEKLPIARVLENACRLAGRKCGQSGFAGLLQPNADE